MYYSIFNLPVGRNIELSLSGGISYAPDTQGARCFALEELNLATKNFNNINLIGTGTFGEAYKGLLQDGMIVAIKRRVAPPSREFIEEVIRHFVCKLIGNKTTNICTYIFLCMSGLAAQK